MTETEVQEVEAPEERAASPVEASASPEPSSANEAPARDLDSELERLSTEASAMRELAQRKQAEFENYRRRVERERMETARYASADVVKEVLPVLDNLERALRAAGGASEDKLRDGVAIIHRQLAEILSRLGLTEVESEGKPFDPHFHEAVSQIETVDQPEGTVLEVLQKGYLFKDRLLRPAMVSVARAPSSGGEEQDGDSEGENEAVPRSE